MPRLKPHQLVLATGVVAWLVVHRSVYGRHLFAVGHNEEASRYSGVRTRGVIACAYVISGTLAAVSAIIIAFFEQTGLWFRMLWRTMLWSVRPPFEVDEWLRAGCFAPEPTYILSAPRPSSSRSARLLRSSSARNAWSTCRSRISRSSRSP